MVKLRRDRTGKVFTNAKGVPLTAAQVDVNEQDEDIARLCEIAKRHLSSNIETMAALLQAKPGLPEKDAYWLADYVMRTDGA